MRAARIDKWFVLEYRVFSPAIRVYNKYMVCVPDSVGTTARDDIYVYSRSAETKSGGRGLTDLCIFG